MSEDISTKLQRNRDAIDAIDHQVVDLLNKRVVSDGGADEATVLEKVAKFNQGPLSDATLHGVNG
jgi:chorismate mutase